MSFGLYALGYIIVIIAVAYMAHLLHVPQNWIVGICLLLLGAGIVTGVQSTRQKDPS
jgi:hypothetical protein